MSTIQERYKEAEKEIIEQSEVEAKLKKKAEKNLVEKKKGQAVNWKPARRLPGLEAPKGFRIAWKNNTPENIRKLQYEGWELANRLEHNIDMKMGDYYKKINDRPLNKESSSILHNELIAMILPEEKALAREEYHRLETEKQTRAKLIPENSGSAISRAAKIKTTIEIN